MNKVIIAQLRKTEYSSEAEEIRPSFEMVDVKMIEQIVSLDNCLEDTDATLYLPSV